MAKGESQGKESQDKRRKSKEKPKLVSSTIAQYLFQSIQIHFHSQSKESDPTNKTFDLNPGGQPTGRYNLLCTKENFVTLAKRLSVELPPLYHDFMTQKGIESSALDETVEVVSNFPGEFGQRSDDEFSGTTIQSRDSYISNCVSLLEAIEFADDTDKTNCARYVETKYKYLQEHNWFSPMTELHQDSSPNPPVAEALDRD
jgi:hypothetical protein